MKTKVEVAVRFKELSQEAMSIWDEVQQLLLDVDGHHGRIIKNGWFVKTPCEQIVASLTCMAKQLDDESDVT